MNALRSPRAAAAITGSLLGALIGMGLNELGVITAFKLDFNLFIPGAIAGAVAGATRARPLMWILAGVVVAMVALTYTPITGALAGPLIRRDSLTSAAPDAIAVLAGGTNPDGTMAGVTLDRLLAGLQLARLYRGTPLLISREMATVGGRRFADAPDQREILALALPDGDVYFADSTTSTRVEALRMRAIARARGWSRIALVTSPLHTRRACATFEAVGFMVTCIPSVTRNGPVWANGQWENGPSLFRGWLYETAGTVKYRSAGWIR